MDPVDRAEEARLKKAAYDQREERKEYRRRASIARSKAHKVMTTKKRLAEHSIDELIYIAQLRCAELGIDFAANEAMLRASLVMLHGPNNA